jgi:hypothetical protein
MILNNDIYHINVNLKLEKHFKNLYFSDIFLISKIYINLYFSDIINFKNLT